MFIFYHTGLFRFALGEKRRRLFSVLLSYAEQEDSQNNQHRAQNAEGHKVILRGFKLAS